MGYIVIVIWECETKKPEDLETTMVAVTTSLSLPNFHSQVTKQ